MKNKGRHRTAQDGAGRSRTAQDGARRRRTAQNKINEIHVNESMNQRNLCQCQFMSLVIVISQCH